MNSVPWFRKCRLVPVRFDLFFRVVLTVCKFSKRSDATFMLPFTWIWNWYDILLRMDTMRMVVECRSFDYIRILKHTVAVLSSRRSELTRTVSALNILVHTEFLKYHHYNSFINPMSQCVVEYELSWLASYSDIKYIFTSGNFRFLKDNIGIFWKFSLDLHISSRNLL